MPVYEYSCSHCNFTAERLEKISDLPEPYQCKKCSEGKVERQIGHALLNFKGSGWASDGYAGKKR